MVLVRLVPMLGVEAATGRSARSGRFIMGVGKRHEDDEVGPCNQQLAGFHLSRCDNDPLQEEHDEYPTRCIDLQLPTDQQRSIGLLRRLISSRNLEAPS